MAYFNDARLMTKNASLTLTWRPGINADYRQSKFVVQSRIDAMALAFSVKYVRVDTGALRDSHIRDTVIGSGLIQGTSPYAKKVYYGGGNVSTERNPYARRLWYEAVKSGHMDEILNAANQSLTDQMGW